MTAADSAIFISSAKFPTSPQVNTENLFLYPMAQQFPNLSLLPVFPTPITLNVGVGCTAAHTGDKKDMNMQITSEYIIQQYTKTTQDNILFPSLNRGALSVQYNHMKTSLCVSG